MKPYIAGLLTATVPFALLTCVLWVYANASIDMESVGGNYGEVKAGSMNQYRYSPSARLNTYNEKSGDWERDRIAASSASAGTGGHVKPVPNSTSYNCWWEDSDHNNENFRYGSYFKATFTAEGCESKDAFDEVTVVTMFQGTPDCCESPLCPYQSNNENQCDCNKTSPRCHLCGYKYTYCMAHQQPNANPHYKSCPLYVKPVRVTNNVERGGTFEPMHADGTDGP